MYAVIESCGKQYKVAEGDVVFFEKLDAEEGKKVTFDKVILVSDEGKVEVGNPYVKGMKVEDVVTKLRGILCGSKPTSCPDQLAICLAQYIKANQKTNV